MNTYLLLNGYPFDKYLIKYISLSVCFHVALTFNLLSAAAAAAALRATLASGEVDNALALPNCGRPAAVDIYADAIGFGSDPI